MIRDKWIYQKRECAHPWAVYMVANDDRITKRTLDVAYTVYCEEIGNEYHSVDAIDVSPFTLHAELETDICENVNTFTHEDHCQLIAEIESFIHF